MGVRGLSSWAHKECRTRRWVVAEEDRRVMLAVDGVGLAFHLFGSSKLTWAWGGSLHAFRAYVVEYLEALGRAKVHVVCFFDDEHQVDSHKVAETLDRRSEELDRIDKIAAAMLLDDVDSTDLERKNTLVLPCLAIQIVKLALVELGMEMRLSRAQAEADPDIARFAKKENAVSGQCCVVLSNDSDMLVLKGIEYVARFHDLVFCPDGDVVLRVLSRPQVLQALLGQSLLEKIMTMNDDNDGGASSSMIGSACLAIVAAVAGNDCLCDPGLLDSLQRKVLQFQSPGMHQRKAKQRIKGRRKDCINMAHLIPKIGSLLRLCFVDDLECADTLVTNFVCKLKLGQDAHSYLNSVFKMYCCCDTVAPVDSGEKSEWWCSRPCLAPPVAHAKGKTVFELLVPLRRACFPWVETEYGPMHGSTRRYTKTSARTSAGEAGAGIEKDIQELMHRFVDLTVQDAAKLSQGAVSSLHLILCRCLCLSLCMEACDGQSCDWLPSLPAADDLWAADPSPLVQHAGAHHAIGPCLFFRVAAHCTLETIMQYSVRRGCANHAYALCAAVLSSPMKSTAAATLS